MLRVAAVEEPRCAAAPPKAVLVPAQAPTQKRHPHQRCHGAPPPLAEIRRELGATQVRCLTRSDGLIYAYVSDERGGYKNKEAERMARNCGIALPDEALPLRGPVLFLGPAESVKRCAQRPKP